MNKDLWRRGIEPTYLTLLCFTGQDKVILEIKQRDYGHRC